MEKLHWLLIALAILLTLTSCRCWRESIPAAQTVHDTVITNLDHFVHDSIYQDKWHTIYQNGDTIHIHDSIVYLKWHIDTLWRDSVMIQRDSVECPVEVIKNKKVRGVFWWTGLICIIGATAYIGYKFYKNILLWKER